MEIWKPVRGFEGIYEVSNLGAVVRVAANNGTQIGKVHKPGKRRGYNAHSLSREGKKYYLSHHRMVWEAFNGPIPFGLHINHMNGDKRDNRLSNLDVVTPSENNIHAMRVLGHVPKNPPRGAGENNPRALVSETQVREIRMRYAQGTVSQATLGKCYGVTQTTISVIISGKSWPNVV